MKPLPVTKAQFDVLRPQLEFIAKGWADAECTSFDDAVHGTKQSDGGGSIWQMPSIDSKRVVSLLVELEPVIGCDLPPSLIRRGGYKNSAELVADVLSRIRERCVDAPTPEIEETAPVASSTGA